tara:strand:+ start:33 stop:464 length:432 start_codon:yes stop_codon:yes gene_type:complete
MIKVMIKIFILYSFLFTSTISHALDIIIACKVINFDDYVYEKILGIQGQTKYFKIEKREVYSNWDEYNYRFSNLHFIEGIDNKYIKFYKSPTSGNDMDSIQVIDRETGVMVTQNLLGQNKKYQAECNKIEEITLPKKKITVKF